MKYERIKGYKNERFRQVTGVSIKTFEAMLEVIKKATAEAKKGKGRKRALTAEDTLLMTLEYYKEYRTFDCIAASYGISKSTVHDTISRVENALIKSGLFALDGKKALVNPEAELEIIVVDSTEIPIERPKKGQKQYYSGKKTAHAKSAADHRQKNRTDNLHGIF